MPFSPRASRSHRRRSDAKRGVSHPPPRGLLTRAQAAAMFHTWDQRIARLRQRVDELEEQNAKLKGLLGDAIHEEEDVARSSHGANMYRFLLSQWSRLRVSWDRLMGRLSVLYHGPSNQRPIGWPFEPVVHGPSTLSTASPKPPADTRLIGPAPMNAQSMSKNTVGDPSLGRRILHYVLKVAAQPLRGDDIDATSEPLHGCHRR